MEPTRRDILKTASAAAAAVSLPVTANGATAPALPAVNTAADPFIAAMIPDCPPLDPRVAPQVDSYLAAHRMFPAGASCDWLQVREEGVAGRFEFAWLKFGDHDRVRAWDVQIDVVFRCGMKHKHTRTCRADGILCASHVAAPPSLVCAEAFSVPTDGLAITVTPLSACLLVLPFYLYRTTHEPTALITAYGETRVHCYRTTFGGIAPGSRSEGLDT